ncbi:MAG: type II CAAX endopeptidase family protein [Spirochaetales bacterium]|nr:type II CAAX endopeptidase family protein [Spirochaetales bacterium]
MEDMNLDMFNSLYFNFMYIITTLPQILLTLYIIVLKPGRNLEQYWIGKIKKTDFLYAVVTFIGIYLCIAFSGLIAVLFEPELDNTLVYGSGWKFNNPALIPLLLISCLLTGYSEEIFFRSYLFKSITNTGLNPILAAVLTSILFGTGHLYEGYYALAATTAIGLFLSAIFIKTRSIHTVAIAHGLYNFSALIISMNGGQI